MPDSHFYQNRNVKTLNKFYCFVCYCATKKRSYKITWKILTVFKITYLEESPHHHDDELKI